MEFFTHGSKKRSILHFIVLAVVLLSVMSFLLNKAGEAVAEMNNLTDMPVYLGVKAR